MLNVGDRVRVAAESEDPAFNADFAGQIGVVVDIVEPGDLDDGLEIISESDPWLYSVEFANDAQIDIESYWEDELELLSGAPDV